MVLWVLDIGHFILIALYNLFNDMAQVYLYKIIEEINKSNARRVIDSAAREKANEIVDEAVDRMRKDFENHPVTKELGGGIDASNISKTLRGGSEPENLYSFIGFEAETDAVQPVREMFYNPESMGIKPTLDSKPYLYKNQPKISYQFKVDYPQVPKNVISETKIPWMKSISWVTQIEDYIPGFKNFLGGDSFKTSRSGGGIQVKGEVRRAEFKAPKNGYLSGIFDKFMGYVRSTKYRNR
jgi:hypothetical protein